MPGNSSYLKGGVIAGEHLPRLVRVAFSSACLDPATADRLIMRFRRPCSLINWSATAAGLAKVGLVRMVGPRREVVDDD